MNVLISAYTCCPNRGSEPGNGWSWIMNYKNNNYNVVVYTSGKYRNEIESFLKETEPIADFRYIDNKISLSLLKFPIIGIYMHYFCWLLKTRNKIRKADTEYKFSHYHHVTYSSIKFGTPLFDLSRPIIIGPLGGATPPHMSLAKYFGKYWKTEIAKEFIANTIISLNPFIKKSIKGASILLVSNRQTENLVNSYEGNGKIINMFDAGLPDYYKIPKPVRNVTNSEITIFWAGRMLPRKGLNLAIEAFRELVNSDKEVKYNFVIAGSGPLINSCKDTVKSYGMVEKITFLGQVSYEQLLEYYCNSHIFLFPSLKDSCPMQVFEAMATGLPVVTLNHQGMADQVINGAGIKIDVRDGANYPLELSNAIKAIIADGPSYSKYSENAYKLGQSQIWSDRIKRFIDYDIRNLINR